MTIDTDFHSHVSRSSARAMVSEAKEQGLRVLGLSEHVFQMREVRPLLAHMPLEGPEMALVDYIEAVHEAGQALQFDVRLGLEVDFIPGKVEAVRELLQGYPWDFLIGSVHEIDGKLLENEEGWGEAAEAEQAWHRYMELLRQAVRSGFFSVVSHPVRLFVENPHLPATIDEELEQLAAEAARCDVALEVNGFDVATYPHVVRRLVRACALQGAPVSVGSDAHYPSSLANSHEASERLLREAGIHRVRIWRSMVAEEYRI
uniref:Histidinol-phosphatase n=1 Tax=Thermogemmatispora argillosa TaxID=2045280 RepID=A0A455T8Q9_9CHLR|nr:histidinol phosphate phosphatase HisJ [Thermogemmatispora argillosa]